MYISKPPPWQQTRLKTMQPGLNILCLSARPVQNKHYGTWNHGVMYKFGSLIWFVNFLYDANTKNWTAYCTNWFPASTLQPKLQTRQCGVRTLLPLGTNQSPRLFACPRWTHLDESFCDHNASAALLLDYRVYFGYLLGLMWRTSVSQMSLLKWSCNFDQPDKDAVAWLSPCRAKKILCSKGCKLERKWHTDDPTKERIILFTTSPKDWRWGPWGLMPVPPKARFH